MASYVTTLRKGIKWYRKLGLELLLGISMVNAWVVYKHVTKKTIKIRTFREEVVKDLLQVRGRVLQGLHQEYTILYNELMGKVKRWGGSAVHATLKCKEKVVVKWLENKQRWCIRTVAIVLAVHKCVWNAST